MTPTRNKGKFNDEDIMELARVMSVDKISSIDGRTIRSIKNIIQRNGGQTKLKASKSDLRETIKKAIDDKTATISELVANEIKEQYISLLELNKQAQEKIRVCLNDPEDDSLMGLGAGSINQLVSAIYRSASVNELITGNKDDNIASDNDAIKNSDNLFKMLGDSLKNGND